MYWPMCCEQVRNCQLFLNIASLDAISSFFPFAMLAESLEISSRTTLQAAPYGVSSLTKSRILLKNLPTNSYEELRKEHGDQGTYMNGEPKLNVYLLFIVQI